MTNVTTVDATHLWRCKDCQDDHTRRVCPACQKPNMDWAYWPGEKVECNGCGATFWVVLGEETKNYAPQGEEDTMNNKAKVITETLAERLVLDGRMLTLESKRKDAMGDLCWLRETQLSLSEVSPNHRAINMLLDKALEANHLYEINAAHHKELDTAELAIGQAMQWLGEWHKAVADGDTDALACKQLLQYKEKGAPTPNTMPGQED